jgi:RimJ/RimL family protein N-acetyltransferase
MIKNNNDRMEGEVMASESVYLRHLNLDDLDRVYRWHNNPDLYETLVATFRHVSRIAEEEWFRKKIAYSTQEVNLAICLTTNSQHIGNIYLQDIDWVTRHASIGIFLGEPDEQSKGYGMAATVLAIKHAFQDLGLNRVYATILADNKAVIKLSEKVGFVVEGRLRKHCFKNGEFKDLLMIGICADDFSLKGM